MSKRAVLYARVSSDDRGKDDRNLNGQLEMCREYASRKGYQVVAELAEDDRGASGAAFELEQLNRVREMAHAGEFDVLVCREIDRLSRSLAKQLIVEEELSRAHVQIEYVLGEYPNTPEGSLMKNVRASVAEYERLKIIERTSRARRLKVKAGNVMVYGRPPYGYEAGKKDGKAILIPQEAEARIVRLIYSWYSLGDNGAGPMTISDIARKLTAMQIPTHADTDSSWWGGKKRGWGVWNRAGVHRILTSETYAGSWHYGKRGRENGVERSHPRESWLAVEMQPIVSREVWKAAQARLTENRENARRNTKYPYLMSRRVTCGKCGLRITGSGTIGSNRKRYQYYRCPGAFQKLQAARDCDSPSYPALDVDGAIWEWVRAFLSDPLALARGITKYQEEQAEQTAPIRGRLEVVQDLIGDNRRQLERLLDLYLSGAFPKEMLTERKARLESTIDALEIEWVSLSGQLDAESLTAEQMEGLQDFAAKVTRGLDLADTDFDTRRAIIEALDVRATLTVENGQQVVYARCILRQQQKLCALSHTTGRGI